MKIVLMPWGLTRFHHRGLSHFVRGGRENARSPFDSLSRALEVRSGQALDFARDDNEWVSCIAELCSAGQMGTSFDFAQDRFCPYASRGGAARLGALPFPPFHKVRERMGHPAVRIRTQIRGHRHTHRYCDRDHPKSVRRTIHAGHFTEVLMQKKQVHEMRLVVTTNDYEKALH